MKSIHIIWNVINTCLIILLAVYVGVSIYIPQDLISKVEKMEIELKAYENIKPDTITVHIDNYINIPKSIKK